MWPSVSGKPVSDGKKFFRLLAATLAFVVIVALLVGVPASRQAACDHARSRGLPAGHGGASDARKDAAETIVRCGTYVGSSIAVVKRELGQTNNRESGKDGQGEFGYDVGLDALELDGVVLRFNYDVKTRKVVSADIDGYGGD